MTTMETETMVTEEMPLPQQQMIMVRQPQDVVLVPVMDVTRAQARMAELQAFCAGYLQESKDGGQDGGDYGVIPGGGKKRVLFKSGAEKLCDVYGLADRYRILSKVEDFDRGLFDYTLECVLVRKTDEMFVGSGLGSCSSFEAKYRWRERRRVCPTCQNETLIKGKAEYGGGWLCWAKKGGCGAKFNDADPAVVGQATGRTENPDMSDMKNTVLKMAKKRAKIDAVIGVTRSSGIFTQDLEVHAEADAVVSEDTPKPVAPVVSKPTKPTLVPKATDAGPDDGDVPEAVDTAAADAHAAKIAKIKAAAAKGPATTPETPTTDAAPAADVFIKAITVRMGDLVEKNGVKKPAWGPLYVVAFTRKVRASDGQMVIDATTFDEKIAVAATAAKDDQRAVTPVIEPGKKKGIFNLMGI